MCAPDSNLVAPLDEGCPICFEMPFENPVVTPGNHWFCKECTLRGPGWGWGGHLSIQSSAS